MPNRLERLFAHRFVSRILHKAAFGAAMLLCIAWAAGAAAVDTLSDDAPVSTSRGFEWPATWDGMPLRPLAFSAVEQRFAERFPGAMARLTDGQRMLVLRHVTAPTRMLHPATDCYRALGYRITDARLEADSQQRRWRCFTATQPGGAPLRVCERIADADGHAFADTSAWYWAAIAGRSRGPWQAVTTASFAVQDAVEAGAP